MAFDIEEAQERKKGKEEFRSVAKQAAEKAQERNKEKAATTIQSKWRSRSQQKNFEKYIQFIKKAEEAEKQAEEAKKQAQKALSELHRSTNVPSFDAGHIQEISDIIISTDYKTKHPDDHLADLTPQQILTLGKALHQLREISENRDILSSIINLAIKKDPSDGDWSTLSSLSSKDKDSIKAKIESSKSILSKANIGTLDVLGYNTYSEAYELYSQVVMGNSLPTLSNDNITNQLISVAEKITISNLEDVQAIKGKIENDDEVKIEDLSDTFREDLINALEEAHPDMSKERVKNVYESFMKSENAQHLDLDTGKTTSGIQANASIGQVLNNVDSFC